MTVLSDTPQPATDRAVGDLISETSSSQVRLRRRERRPYLSLAVLTLFVLAGLLGPIVAPRDPNELNLGSSLMPPVWAAGGSWRHILGTDELGRDLFSRLLYGAQVSFIVSLAAVVISGTIGVLLALVAGYRRGKIDTLVTRVADASIAFPILLLAIVLVGIFGPSAAVVIGILSVAGWSQYCRVVRSEVLSLSTREFVVMSKVMGAKSRWIIVNHILPNVVNTVLVLATIQMGIAVIAEGSLSFLGIGVPPPAVSWGGMLADGRKYLTTAWWLSAIPGVALSAVVLSANVVGDWMRVRNDPTRGR